MGAFCLQWGHIDREHSSPAGRPWGPCLWRSAGGGSYERFCVHLAGVCDNGAAHGYGAQKGTSAQRKDGRRSQRRERCMRPRAWSLTWILAACLLAPGLAPDTAAAQGKGAKPAPAKSADPAAKEKDKEKEKARSYIKTGNKAAG